MIPYSWERLSGPEAGFFCLFKEGFINNHFKSGSLALSPLFKAGGTPVLYPDENKVQFFRSLFEQILQEVDSTYDNKIELLQNYLQILIHESLKLPATGDGASQHNSYSRISVSFLQLLELQFPVTSQEPVRLKTVKEFADQLSVHPNHLNKAVKLSTNKTTTAHIQDKIMTEARTILKHTTWEIADISHGLGFLHPSNFITFFKKRSGITPHQFRKRSM
jgi:AraC-like DNA-binding protein